MCILLIIKQLYRWYILYTTSILYDIQHSMVYFVCTYYSIYIRYSFDLFVVVAAVIAILLK